MLEKISFAPPNREHDIFDGYLRPRMSLNKFGEYLTASPSKQSQLIQQAKYPKASFFKWFGELRSGLSNYFVDGYDRKNLIQLRENLEGLMLSEPKREKEAKAAILHLEGFWEGFTPFESPFQVSKFTRGEQALNIGGLQVFADPDLRLVGAYRKAMHLGGVKYYINKSPLGKISAEAISLLMAYYLEHNMPEGFKGIKRGWLYTIDVRRGTVFSCPKDYKSLSKDIFHAGKAIAERWSSIPQPTPSKKNKETIILL